MSGPCTDCGGPDYQTLEARIAELEAEVDQLRAKLTDCAKTCGGLEFHRDALLEELDDEGDAKDAALAMLDVAEAELARLKSGLAQGKGLARIRCADYYGCAGCPAIEKCEAFAEADE